MFDPRIGNWGQLSGPKSVPLFPKPKPKLFIAPCEAFIGVDFASFDQGMINSLLHKNANFVKNWLETHNYLTKEEDAFHSEAIGQPFEVKKHVFSNPEQEFGSFDKWVERLEKRGYDTPKGFLAYESIAKFGWSSAEIQNAVRAVRAARPAIISIGFYEGPYTENVEMMSRPLCPFVRRKGTVYRLHVSHNNRFYYCSISNDQNITTDLAQNCNNADNMAWSSQKPNMMMPFFGGHMSYKHVNVLLAPENKLPETLTLTMDVKSQWAQLYYLCDVGGEKYYLEEYSTR